jgi:hypothetical protein
LEWLPIKFLEHHPIKGIGGHALALWQIDNVLNIFAIDPNVDAVLGRTSSDSTSNRHCIGSVDLNLSPVIHLHDKRLERIPIQFLNHRAIEIVGGHLFLLCISLRLSIIFAPRSIADYFFSAGTIS